MRRELHAIECQQTARKKAKTIMNEARKAADQSTDDIIETMAALEAKIDQELAEFGFIHSAIDESIQAVEKETNEEPLSEEEMKHGVLNGTIPSGAADSAATSNAYRSSDPYIWTGGKSNKIFQMPTGAITPATDEGLLLHAVRESARTVDIVPAITAQSLLSMGNLLMQIMCQFLTKMKSTFTMQATLK